MMKRPKQNPKLKNVQNYWHKKGWEDREKFLPSEEEILNIIEGELMKELSNEVVTCERFEYPIFKKVAKAIHRRITEGAE